MNLLGKYKNGNYIVKIYSDGSKIRMTKEDGFIPAFSESCDIKITNQCDQGCAMCHEGSTPDGQHGDILSTPFLDTLHPYTELAIGGGDATSHPDLIPFLRKLKEKKVIANMTVNQTHFMQKQDLIRQLVDEKLIYGLGVSLVNPTKEFVTMVKQYPNAVIHVINGLFSIHQAEDLFDQGLKLLILGYKQLRRGAAYFDTAQDRIQARQTWLYDALPFIKHRFKTISFDNLAIQQLDVKRLMSEDQWQKFYMGDDAQFTFYIDMVNRQFARSSTAPFEERYKLLDSIDDMFQMIRAKEGSA